MNCPVEPSNAPFKHVKTSVKTVVVVVAVAVAVAVGVGVGVVVVVVVVVVAVAVAVAVVVVVVVAVVVVVVVVVVVFVVFVYVKNPNIINDGLYLKKTLKKVYFEFQERLNQQIFPDGSLEIRSFTLHKTMIAPARRPGPKEKLIFQPQCVKTHLPTPMCQVRTVSFSEGKKNTFPSNCTSWHTPGKLKWQWQSNQFEDVSPIKNGAFPVPCYTLED